MTLALPLARQESLIVKELADETLVYDLKTDQAHCLNQTAALVWNNCDGRKSVSEIAGLLQKKLQAPIDNQVIWMALDQLEEFKLLERPVLRPPHIAGMSRRQMVRAMGLAAAVALPLITSIVVPTAAQAASCTAQSQRDLQCPCSNNAECASGCCDCEVGVCIPQGCCQFNGE
jgi:hypothetical protein